LLEVGSSIFDSRYVLDYLEWVYPQSPLLPSDIADQFGLGDIAVGSVLGYLKVRFQEFDWQILYPALAQYSAILEQRPSFQHTQPYPQTISDKVV
jgi:glutathione S-transferase